MDHSSRLSSPVSERLDLGGTADEPQEFFPPSHRLPLIVTLILAAAGAVLGPVLFPEPALWRTVLGGLLLGGFGGLCAFAHRFLE